MSDTFGAVAIPLAVPAAGVAVADPCLTTINSYFQAVLNANAQAAWTSVAPGGASVVRATFTHDPEVQFFNEGKLPALFTWRTGGQSEYIADDYEVFSDSITCRWIFAPAQQATQRTRDSFTAGIVKVLDVMIERGADPSWVVVGDTDPKSATRGSLLLKTAGLMSMKMTKWADRLTTIRMAGGAEPRVYEGVEIIFAIEELLTIDAGRFPFLGCLDLTTTTSDGLITDRAVVGRSQTGKLGTLYSTLGNIKLGALSSP